MMNNVNSDASQRKSRRGFWVLMAVVALLLVTSIILGLCVNAGIFAGSPKTVKIVIEERPEYLLQLIANGGLKTQPDSIYDKLGINVEFVIDNNEVDCVDAVISGEVAGFSTSINRYPMMREEFDAAGLEVIMPYIAARSNGADVLVVSEEIKSINALFGKKLAIPTETDAQVLIEWLMANFALEQEELQQIHADMEYCDTHEEAIQRYISGAVDAVVTRGHNVAKCQQERKGTRVLFDTRMVNNLVMDGFVFRKDFLEGNEDFVAKFVEGSLQARELYETEVAYLKEMPAFSALSDVELMAVANSATPLSWTKNMEMLSGAAQELYAEMADLWKSMGINADPNKAQSAFTDKYMQSLAASYQGEVEPNGDAPNGEEIDVDSLLKKGEIIFERSMLCVNYEKDEGKLLKNSEEFLRWLVNATNSFNASSTYIVVEANVSLRNFSYPGMNDQLMYDFTLASANAVKQYLIDNGVNHSRILIVANGDNEVMALYASSQARAEDVRKAEGAAYHTEALEAIEEMAETISEVYEGSESEQKERAAEAVKNAQNAFSDVKIAYEALQNAVDGKAKKAAEYVYANCVQHAYVEFEQLIGYYTSALREEHFRQTTISFVYTDN